jgi:hypothetical protein
MTHREFVSWKAFFKLSPFDDQRCFDAPAARVATATIRSQGGKAKFEDFMPYRKQVGVPNGTGELSDDDIALMNYMGTRGAPRDPA